MAESNTLMRVVFFLGLTFFIVGLMFPGQDAAWNNFRASISVGPQFPTFQNPFDTEAIQTTSADFMPGVLQSALGPGGDPSQAATNGTANGCSNANAWLCVRDFNGTDGNLSTITLAHNGGACFGPFITLPCSLWAFNLIGPKPGTLRTMFIDVWCRSPFQIPLQIQAAAIDQYDGANYQAWGTSSDRIACAPSDSFHKVTVRVDACTGCTPSDLNAPWTVSLNIFGGSPPSPYRIDVTTIRGHGIFAPPVTQCNGGDFFGNTGCQISQFFITISKGLQFFANGLVFIGVSIFAILAFIFLVIVGLLIGVFTTMGWFLNFSANTGAPSFVGVLVGIPITAMVAWVLYVILKTVRGTSTV